MSHFNHEILTALHDRAGNLENENLLNKNTPEGKVSCSLCGIRLNHNNLLPDKYWKYTPQGISPHYTQV